MKPFLESFCVVTATTNAERARKCVTSWFSHATYDWTLYTIHNGGEGLVRKPHLGVVPAFAQGMAQALSTKASIICCLHDDVLIEEAGWDARILDHFDKYPKCGLLGFGGGTGLGAADIYRRKCEKCKGIGHTCTWENLDAECPDCQSTGISWDPMQLARQDFISNMREAEAHGRRVREAERVSCLDGFSQVGRRSFWQDCFEKGPYRETGRDSRPNLFQTMADLGIVHHAYDAALGCYAARLSWETWMLPVACHHLGGQTAVTDEAYHTWAKTQHPEGDQGFWKDAHRIVYDEFKDILPLRR